MINYFYNPSFVKPLLTYLIISENLMRARETNCMSCHGLD